MKIKNNYVQYISKWEIRENYIQYVQMYPLSYKK